MAAAKPKVPVVKVKLLYGNTSIVPEGNSTDITLCPTYDMRILPTTACASAYEIPLGISISIPEGYHGKLLLHPSINKCCKIRPIQGVMIIPSGITKELIVLVENVGPLAYNIYPGDKLFQILIEKNEEFIFEQVEEL